LNWEAIGAVGEVLGALVVLATIIYLAIQTRISVKVAKAQTPQWISDGINSWVGSMRNDPELIRLIRISLHHWSDLSLNDQTRVHSFFTEMMIHLDAILELSTQGLTERTRVQAWIENAAGVLATEGGAKWWSQAKFFFSPILRETLDSRMLDKENPPTPWTIAPFYMLEEADFRQITKVVKSDVLDSS
jgi:hypothetical protein